MTPETLKALHGSIAKWEAIVDGTGKDEGIDNCPLCQIFHPNIKGDILGGCDGCPVMDRTGENGCYGSPYEEWTNYTVSGKIYDDYSRELAQAELDFLRSLLPPEPAP